MNPDYIEFWDKYSPKLEQINELKQIMITRTINSQDAAHDAVRNKRYIVGSYCPANGISFSDVPVLHPLRSEARAECKRLANLNPGKTFLIACLEGAEMIVPKPTSISI
jgi:hypothetical protein